MDDETKIFIVVFVFILLIAIGIFSCTKEKMKATSFFSLGVVAGILIPVIFIGMNNSCKFNSDGFMSQTEKDDTVNWANNLYAWSKEKMPTAMEELHKTIVPYNQRNPVEVEGESVDISASPSHSDFMNGENHIGNNPMREVRKVQYLGDIDIDEEDQKKSHMFQDYLNSKEVRETQIRNENAGSGNARNPHLINQLGKELANAEKTVWWESYDE